jgi:hypothetical protein
MARSDLSARQSYLNLGRVTALALLSALVAPTMAFAWGASGHRMIGELAIQSLPPELPAFLRKAEAARQVAEVAREPDRAKGASEPYDSDANAAHHVNVGDDLKIARGPSLSALPANREAYDAALRALGTNQYRAGYLPYAIIDSWQQVVMDFAYWRADVAGARYAKTPAERSWFLQDQWIREGLTIRDLGYLAHFVGDGSQPLHISVHSDGWGNYPNPQNFSATRGFRALLDRTITRGPMEAKDVAAHVAPYRNCRCSIQQRTSGYLSASQREVIALFQLEKAGGFAARPDDGKVFVSKRLAAGAAELRDMITDAWRRSADVSVGTPAIPVRDIESGATNAFTALRGAD